MEEFEFDLENPRENLDGVPDDLQKFYVQGDNGYTVGDDYIPTAKRINGLTKNFKAEKSKRTQAGRDAGAAREAKKQFDTLVEGIDDLEDKTPAGLSKYLDDLKVKAAAGGKKGEEAQKAIDAIKSEMSKTHATALAEKDEAITKLGGKIESLVAGREITEALAENKAKGKFLQAFVKQHVKTIVNDDGEYQAVVLDEKGETRYNGAGDPMSVREFVVSLKADPDFAAAFEGETKGGAGVTPGSTAAGARPKPGTNLTATDRIAAGLRKRS